MAVGYAMIGIMVRNTFANLVRVPQIEGILPKGSYPPCWRMADRALLAGYPRNITHQIDIGAELGLNDTNIVTYPESQGVKTNPCLLYSGWVKVVILHHYIVILKIMKST